MSSDKRIKSSFCINDTYIGYILFKVLCGYFGGTNVYIAKLLSDGGVWANLVSIGAVMLSLLLSLGVVAASWNNWEID